MSLRYDFVAFPLIFEKTIYCLNNIKLAGFYCRATFTFYFSAYTSCLLKKYILSKNYWNNGYDWDPAVPLW